jgi:hypothetical protein
MGSASSVVRASMGRACLLPLDGINLTIRVLAFFLLPDSRCFPLFGLLLPQTPFLFSP